MENASLGGIEPGAPLVQGLKGAIEAAALAGPVAKGHHVGLLLLVGRAQFRGVADPIEMAHHSPTPAQPLAQVLQGIHHLGPAQRWAIGQASIQPGFQFREFPIQFGQEVGDGLLHLIRGDGRKVGKAVACQ